MNINNAVHHRFAPFLFVSPFLVIFFVLNFYPLLVSLYISMHDWLTGSALSVENMVFDPLHNYTIALTHPLIKDALINTTLVALLSVFLVHSLALGLSKLILNSFTWIQGLLLVMLFAPFILSETSLSDSYINGFWQIRGWIESHMQGDTVPWFWQLLNNRYPALFVVFVLGVKYIGFFTLVYTMVLRTVSNDIKDAAYLEGASSLLVFFKIEIPAIRSMIIAMVILSFIFFVQSSEVSVYLKNHHNERDIGVTYFSLMMKLLGDREFGPAASLSWAFISALVSIALVIFVILRMLKSKNFKKIIIKKVDLT
ncbi:carbohydrate ABC transporter permease [Marinicellulosiphila megalodicopiae]|uniref:carbohydrate ABC transporter permease n=1 Tax=Marinicellulosiphila megalodicopiae TaxID=2724896 RepID=UPI003BAF1AC5